MLITLGTLCTSKPVRYKFLIIWDHCESLLDLFRPKLIFCPQNTNCSLAEVLLKYAKNAEHVEYVEYVEYAEYAEYCGVVLISDLDEVAWFFDLLIWFKQSTPGSVVPLAIFFQRVSNFLCHRTCDNLSSLFWSNFLYFQYFAINLLRFALWNKHAFLLNYSF